MYTENQIQIFVLISSIFIGIFILTTVFFIVRLKLKDILLKKSEEELREYSENLEKMVAERTKQLSKSEESYKQLYKLNEGIVENSPAGIIKLDDELKIRYENPEMKRILGIPSGDESKTMGMDIRELPSVKSTGKSSIFNDLLEVKEITIETPFTSIYGKETYITIRGVPIFENDKFAGAVLLINDTTERKYAETALQKEKDYYHSFVTSLSDWVWEIDMNGIHTYSNPAVESILGYKVDEVVGHHFTELWLDYAKTPKTLKWLKNTLALGKGWKNYTGKFKQKNGSIIITESTAIPIFNSKHKLIGYRGIDHDITERKRADEALKDSEKKFRDLFENANDVIWTSDIRGRYLSVNHLFEKLLGYTIKELINKQSLYLVAQEDKKKSIENYQKAISGEPVEFEITILSKENERKIFWIKLRPIEENGKVTGIHGIGRDLTRRKEADEALFQAEVQLRQAQKMEAVGRLAGGMAHDFNNLLTAITGYSELLLDKLEEIDPLSKYPKEIRNAAEQASSLTSQLLTFSRKQVLEFKVLDLNAVVTDMQKMLHRLIGEDIELVTVLEQKLGHVKADIGQINQVIMNILVNARDAMPKGGKINLETANVELDEEYARRHVEVQAGPYVMLAITDTGCGMDEETQSHIFEPFFTTKEINKGTGLGLSTVYGIIKQSGGIIWVYSELEQGTTFKIYLPRVDEGIELHKPTIAEPELLEGSETILLVEDQEIVRNLIIEILELSGYKVLAASLGREAISICKQYKGPIHLMLTDVVMPEMSGRELDEQLKPLRPDMKVLFMSGYTGKEVIDRGILEPGTAFIQKPMSPKTLAHKVREVLEAPIQKKG